MNSISKKLAGVLLAGVVAMSVVACGGTKAPDTTTPGTPGTTIEGTITASGSTALLPLVTRAKEMFEAKNAKVTVNVSGGGSGTGLTQVAGGSVNIGNSDVEPSAEQAKDLVDHKVAVAPFVFITNKDVTATNVTLDQMAKILKGEITNWKDVGGKDAKITVISRQASSGSRATIVKTVLKGQGDIAKTAIVQDSNGKIVESVTGTPGAVGYVDSPYYKPDQVGALKLDGVAYSPEAVTSGKWPVYAYEHMYTKGEAKDATKAFIDFMMSKDFQEKELEAIGFIPVSKMTK
jgi:phosphate transport system substrate-binding protein